MHDEQEIIELACRVIDEVFVGVMTTVDSHHAPVSRMMGAVIDDDGPYRLFSLSASDTRKTLHLQTNPAVCWVFATPSYDKVVTLRGDAKRLGTPSLPQLTWDRLADWARPFAANVLTDESHHAFCTIVSDIHTLEFLCPDLGIKSPRILKLDALSWRF